MLKLYKKENRSFLYAECWVNNDIATVHTGTVGEEGESKETKCSDEASFVDEFHQQYAAQGYAQWPEDGMYWVVLQWPMESMKETPYIRSIRDYGIKYLNEILGWTGLGHVDGFDIGRTGNPNEEFALNIFCEVVDKKTAIKCILEKLPAKLDCHSLKIASRADGEEIYKLDYVAKKVKKSWPRKNEFYI